MTKVPTIGLRIVGLMAMAFAIAHCGDSDVHVSTGGGTNPTPGAFGGTLQRSGGNIFIKVGSIEAIRFDCDNEVTQESFSPAEPVKSDGTFNVSFTDGGRKFRVTGTFRD